jgi:peroxiredoxin
MRDQVPHATFHTRVRNEALGGPNPYEWKHVTSEEIFKGKNVVVFSLPGAFTPTCSTSHLPRYEELYDEFKKQGVDAVYCLSVNDAFVMFQWGKAQNANNVRLLPDGNGEFTRKMGMLVDKSNLGFGMRSWRYSMHVVDGKIEKMFIEPDFGDVCPTDPFEVSDADTMLAYLKGSKQKAA